MTSDATTHDTAREALEALAIDALDAWERDAVMSHVEQCPACRAELAVLRITASELAYGVRPAPMASAQRDRIRARLMSRAGADVAAAEPTTAPQYQILVPHPAQVETKTFARNWMTSTSSWIAMAAAIVAVASVTSLIQVSSERDTIAAAYQLATTDRATGSTLVDSLRSIIDDRDQMIANLTGPKTAVVSLASSSAPSPKGHMFWDQSSNQWIFVGHNLPRPKPGRVYQLWLVTASQKISGGVFMPQSNGDAMVKMRYALPNDALMSVAVTDEPAEGSPQPTTMPYIAGARTATR
ncbi:MAG TPA: anti-sigma factor [Gemmatimonadaceae bacterium]